MVLRFKFLLQCNFGSSLPKKQVTDAEGTGHLEDSGDP